MRSRGRSTHEVIRSTAHDEVSPVKPVDLLPDLRKKKGVRASSDHCSPRRCCPLRQVTLDSLGIIVRKNKKRLQYFLQAVQSVGPRLGNPQHRLHATLTGSRRGESHRDATSGDPALRNGICTKGGWCLVLASSLSRLLAVLKHVVATAATEVVIV